ncbi:hypothetical protein GCM10007907_25720 [Chitinimonas prasina]|uniref:Uncharacterized protein n=1 Tax=Chitinimonas prasina TaxID=1434937 RepID=A0ABQ5YJC7_9NEIS|nr:hypothetical protein GCM10007907_25720 [Chitinimonas prasina]
MQALQRGRQTLCQHQAGFGQLHAWAPALKQGLTAPMLQSLYMAADGAVSQVTFRRGAAEATQAGSSFEGLQAWQGR